MDLLYYMQARQAGTHRSFRRMYEVRPRKRYVWAGPYGALLRRRGRARGVTEHPKQFQYWCRERGLQPRLTAVDPYPWVSGDRDGLDRELLRRLNLVGRDLQARVYVRSGLRTRAEQQALWDQNMHMVNGRWVPKPGRPLTAYPGTSNHEDRDGDGDGDAADCQLHGRHGPNIGDVLRARTAMRRRGVCLPVPGERWHVERGRRWAA